MAPTMFKVDRKDESDEEKDLSHRSTIASNSTKPGGIFSM